MGKVLIDETMEAEKIDFGNLDAKEYQINEKKQLNELDGLLAGYNKKSDVSELPAFGENSEETQPEKPKRRRGRKTKAEKMQISGEVISGALFMTFLDMLLPMLIATVNNVMDKKNKVDFKKLQMTAGQKAELEPIADQVMSEMMVKANPWVLLIGSIFSVYTLNFVEAKYS